MYCSACGASNTDWSQVCGPCGRALQAVSPAGAYAMARSTPMKNPGVAAVLSFFFVGLGQIYNGQIGKGILLLFCGAISVAMMAILIGFITTPILWIWGIVDAYRTAEHINVGSA